MAGEQFLTIMNTQPNKLINRAYKDIVFQITGKELINELYGGTIDFKYHLGIFINGTQVAELRSPTGYFHIEQILQDNTETDNDGYARIFQGYLQPQSSSGQILFQTKPHSIHSIDKFALNKKNFQMLQFTIGASFTNEPAANVYEFKPAEMIGVTGSKHVLNRYYFWNACQEWKDGDETDYEPYILDATNKKFLTNQDNDFERGVRLNDYHTFGFFNGRFCDTPNQNHGHGHSPCKNSQAKWFYAELRSISGALIGYAKIENKEDNGGTYLPDLDGFILNEFKNMNPLNKALLYVGVGPKNIIGAWTNTNDGNLMQTSDFQDVAYYDVYATAAEDPSARKSQKYRFVVKEDDCKGYETVRLAYLNRQGTWDYMNFTKKSTMTTDITRSNFKQTYGYTPIYQTTFNEGNGWDYGKYEGGTRTYNVNAIDTYEANSDWITEENATYLQELFTSPDVYRMDNLTGEFYPVVVTEKDYTKQTQANDKMIQYVITVQDGHENRIQRL